jgi:predicted negative regulator of RcsB-dependent stress response
MKTIADEIIEIQIRKFWKCVFLCIALIVLFYVLTHVGIGLYDQHKTQVAQAQAYVADVREVIKQVESDAKR